MSYGHGGHHRTLSDWEEAEILRVAMKRPRSITPAQLADRHGVSRRTIYRTLARRRGYCSVAPCPVLTPRATCFFHSRPT